MSERSALIMDNLEDEGTVSVFLTGFAEHEIDVPSEVINADSVAIIAYPEGGYIAISVADEDRELVAVVSSEQFYVAALAATGNIEEIEESIQ